jgi:hypothetical protein
MFHKECICWYKGILSQSNRYWPGGNPHKKRVGNLYIFSKWFLAFYSKGVNETHLGVETSHFQLLPEHTVLYGTPNRLLTYIAQNKEFLNWNISTCVSKYNIPDVSKMLRQI